MHDCVLQTKTWNLNWTAEMSVERVLEWAN